MFPWAFAASLERSFIVGDGQHCPQVPRNLRSQSACDSNVNSNRKWPVIHGRAPALWLSQLSVHRAHTHTHAHANTAGLPVSADLGGASETLHAFHNHSSPTIPTSKLAPSSSSSFILFHLSPLPCLPFAFISGERARASLGPPPVSWPADVKSVRRPTQTNGINRGGLDFFFFFFLTG